MPYSMAAKEQSIRWVASSPRVRRAHSLLPYIMVALACVWWRDRRALVRERDGAVASPSLSPLPPPSAAAALAAALPLLARSQRSAFSLLLGVFVSRAYYLARNNATALVALEQSAIDRDYLQFTPSDTSLRLLNATYATAFRPLLLNEGNIPAERPLLFVGNHPVLALDAPVLVAELYKRTGLYLRVLADHSHFEIPGNAALLRSVVGAVDGTRRNCAALFDAGQCVLVYPGGARETFKRTTDEKYALEWGRKLGFAKMAVDHGVTIVPVCSVGTEDMTHIVYDLPLGWVPVPFLWGSDRTLPLFTPTTPQRVYFGFGRPIRTAGRLEAARARAAAVREAGMRGAGAPDADTMDELSGSAGGDLWGGLGVGGGGGVLSDAEPGGAGGAGAGNDDAVALEVYRAVRDECKAAVQDGISELKRYRERDPNRMTVDAARHTAAEFIEQKEGIELVIEYMRAKRVEVYCMQETWLGGSGVYCNKGFTIIYTNVDGARRGGVGIVLSPAATRAWDATGRERREPSERVTAARLLYTDETGKEIGVCVVSGWRPTTAATEAEHAKFDADLEEAMDLAHTADLLMVHLDGNGAVGVASKEDEDPALGPHGIAHRNGAGLRLLDFMRAREMCAATSFFLAGSMKGMACRRRDKQRNAKAGGSRRNRARRWRRKQVQRERAACRVSRRAQGAAGGGKKKRQLVRAEARARASEVSKTRARAKDERYASWTHFGTKRHYQLDHVWVRQRDRRALRRARVTLDRVSGSDHRAVMVDTFIARRLKAGAKGPPKPRVVRRKLLDEEVCGAFGAKVIEKLDAVEAQREVGIEDVDTALAAAAEELLGDKGKRQPGWFGAASGPILAACQKRNTAWRKWVREARGRRAGVLRSELREARAAVRTEVRKARNAWLEAAIARVETCRPGGAPLTPSDAWDAMKKLAAGMDETAPPRAVPLKVPGGDGRFTKTAKQRLEVFANHFKAVFQRKSTFDPSVLDELVQRDVLEELGAEPTVEELERLFSKSKSEKAAGLSGAAAEYYKAALVNPELKGRIVKAVLRAWRSAAAGGSMVGADKWQAGRLKEVPKAGKDLSNPSNFRGVMLIEVGMKVLSALVNDRLQVLLRKVGRESQNGFTNGGGCADSSFCLRSILQTLREHGHTAWVCFIDLVKAFDSVDRKAMCAILLKYGCPASLVNVVRAMHDKVIVRMEEGDDAVEFLSTLGVLQGAAASPVLFLFVIQAWFETMQWPSPDIVFKTSDGRGERHEKADGRLDAKLTGRTSKDVGSAFSVRDTLYADDAALITLGRGDMQITMRDLIKHGVRWGLGVHVAKGAGGSSKTEFIVVEPASNHPNRGLASYVPPDKSPMMVGEHTSVTHARVEVGGKVLAGVFKYLGSFIAEDLKEDTDVDARILAASKASGRFSTAIFRNRSISLEAKSRAFSAFVLSILLYQVEVYALGQDLVTKLQRFLNDKIRAMPGRARGRPQQTFRHRLESLLDKVVDSAGVGVRRELLSEGWVAAAGIVDNSAPGSKNRFKFWRENVVNSFCGIDSKKRSGPTAAGLLEKDRREHGVWPVAPFVVDGCDSCDVYTDGSALDNGEENAKAGAGVFVGKDSVFNVAQPLGRDEPQTNNRGELTAILIALQVMEEEIAEGDRPVAIGTDSAYSIMVAGDCGRKARARGWKSSRRKKLKNLDLIKNLLEWRAAYGNWFQFVHIYSHTGKQDQLSIGNHGADRLAVRVPYQIVYE
eukprot:g2695.t1